MADTGPCAASCGNAGATSACFRRICGSCPCVDHTVPRAQLAKRIACRGTFWMLDRILANGASLGLAIECFPCDTLFIPMERPRCLPIGNLTSQIRCT